MPQLNIRITDDVYRAAKDGADKDGMLIRRWVERAIMESAKTHTPKQDQPAEARQ